MITVAPTLEGRYVVGSPLAPGLYEVRDLRVPEVALVLQERPAPAGEGLRSLLESQRKACSWLRHPRIEAPRDLFLAPGLAGAPSSGARPDRPLRAYGAPLAVFAVLKPLEGQPLVEALRTRRPDLAQVVHWAVELCELLEALRQPALEALELGAVSRSHLLVDRSGHLALVGLRLDADCRLRLEEIGEDRGWQPPDGTPSDVWTVGAFLRRLLSPTLLEGVDRSAASSVSRITLRATALEPGARFSSLANLRAHLEEALLALRPPPVPAPTTVMRSTLRVRRSFLQQVGAGALLALVLGFTAWGLAGAGRALARNLPAALAASAAHPEQAVPGRPAWFHGTVRRAGESASSALTGTPSVAYEARLWREVARETWREDSGQYVEDRYREMLLDRSGSVPFLLEDGGKALRVQGGPPVLAGGRRPLEDLAAAHLLERASTVEVGERVLSMAGYERAAVPGQPVLVRGRVDHSASPPVLRLEADGGANVFLGGRVDAVALALMSALPGCLAALLGALAMLLLAQWSGLVRSRWRRRAVARVAS